MKSIFKKKKWLPWIIFPGTINLFTSPHHRLIHFDPNLHPLGFE